MDAFTGITGRFHRNTHSAHTDCRHDLAKPEGSVQRFGQDAAALVRALRQWLRLASEARTAATDIATGKKRA